MEPSLILPVVLVGAGATLLTDAWALVRRRLWDVPLPDWARVGRWLANVPRGDWVLASKAPVRGERAIGWIAHYAIGIAFAAMLVAWRGADWLRAPTLAPALAFGVATVAAPYFVLQPGLGLGLAARRAPRPWAVRAHSLITHAVFGCGLYLAARLIAG